LGGALEWAPESGEVGAVVERGRMIAKKVALAAYHAHVEPDEHYACGTPQDR
jgi:hypothetical protein